MSTVKLLQKTYIKIAMQNPSFKKLGFKSLRQLIKVNYYFSEIAGENYVEK